MEETFDFMLKYGSLIISILITVLSIIIAFIKAKKSGNSKGMLQILEKIPSLITKAETLFGKGKGSAKLDYVLTQLRLYALQNNIKIDDDDLTAQVNSVVETTNNVNIDKKLSETIPSAKDAQIGMANENATNTAQNSLNI